MKIIEQNGFHGSVVAEDPSKQAGAGQPPIAHNNRPYVPEKEKGKPSLKNDARLLVVGGGIVLVLFLLVFSGISNRRLVPPKRATSKRQQQTQPQNGMRQEASMTPIIDAGRSWQQDTDTNLVHPDQIGRTANQRSTQGAPTNLGSVRPFDNAQAWQAPPYQPGSQPADSYGGSAAAPSSDTRSERDSMDKASLVFVRNSLSSASSKSQDPSPAIDWEIGLAPGTKLRARLESAVSTAVLTPVIAVIQYNYERGSEIVIPAGTKAFGHLEAADRSGYVGIRFDSLMMPEGSSMSLEAAATDLQLRPLRGKVESKQTGKNILVRSFAGLGEIAAMLVGRGSLHQPLSEDGLLRERVSNNIGQASDQTVASLAITEHIVVSVPAGTEMYLVLQKSAKEIIPRKLQPTQTISQPSIEELRQLIQLPSELNETAAKPSPE